jgi:hypothetical protein
MEPGIPGVGESRCSGLVAGWGSPQCATLLWSYGLRRVFARTVLTFRVSSVGHASRATVAKSISECVVESSLPTREYSAVLRPGGSKPTIPARRRASGLGARYCSDSGSSANIPEPFA